MPEPAPRLHRAPSAEPGQYLAVIRVVGVGGAGLNAVNRMIDAGISDVEFVAVNTDIQQLALSDAPMKIHIGRELTQGLGSGPRSTSAVALLRKPTTRSSALCAARTWSSSRPARAAAPARAQPRSWDASRVRSARSRSASSLPFHFEGHEAQGQADQGVAELRENCDTVIVIPNDRLLEVLDRSTSMLDAFRIADDVLRQGVQGITDLITMPG